MLILVYGKNTFLSQHKVAQMRERFIDKFDASGMNLAEFQVACEKLPVGDVMQAVQTPPFLAEKRMVIVRGLLSTLKKDDCDPWIDGFNKTPDSTIVILWDSESVKMSEKHHLFKSLIKGQDVHTYPMPMLEGAQLTAWAAEQARDLKLKIDNRLLQKVVAMVGDDLWQLSGELKKLAAYSGGQDVTDDMVSEMVRANFEDQIFAFVDAVAAKNSAQAIKLMQEQRLAGSTDSHLFAMLARQVRLLISARDVIDRNPRATKSDVASALGVHPFVAQKSLAQARQITMDQLKHLHGMLFDLDRKLKRSKVSAEVAVDRLVAEMLT
ncbi:MAG: DNA polymerase III subunit delta [bacterium]